MSAVARHPELLSSLFLTKEFNAAGIYAVSLYVRGKPYIVTVDDTFLFLKKEDTLRYSMFDTKDNTIWAPILEKAYAKVKGNYQFLEAGLL